MDVDIDPEIAEAMGFSAFGTQSQQKRKFNANDVFTDIDSGGRREHAEGSKQGNGANSLPLGKRKSRGESAAEQENVHASSKSSAMKAEGAETNEGKNDLQALRDGVKNDRGDMVYFMPNFIEDPWKDLNPR